MVTQDTFVNFPNLLTSIETARANFQAALRERTGINLVVEVSVFSGAEPHAQALVEAARELGWQVDKMQPPLTSGRPYDQAKMMRSPGEGSVIYGPRQGEVTE
jgi:hypothetical protein